MPLLGLCCLVLASLVSACSSGVSTEPRRSRPNIALVVVDTLRGDHITGDDRYVVTPSLDKLVEEGASFRRAFSHAPITLPSHTALFSSRPVFETGVLNNGYPVRSDLPLLAEWLGKYGYETRAIVSMGTLMSSSDVDDIRRGFDSFDQEFWRMAKGGDISERVRPYLDQLSPDRPFFLFAHYSDPHEPYTAHRTIHRDAKIHIDGNEVATVRASELTMWSDKVTFEPGVHTIGITSDYRFQTRAVEVLDEDGNVVPGRFTRGLRLMPVQQAAYAIEIQGDQPRTCNVRVWVNDYLGKTEKVFRYQREVEYVDRCVGQLIDDLRERDLYDDTIVVFTSDHGEALNERGHIGHIQHLYDEQLHVPLVIRLPEGDDRLEHLRAKEDIVVPHLDVVPTLLDLVGLPALPEQRGVSLLDGGSQELLAQTHRPQAKHDLLGLRDEQYKLIYVADQERFEMYDLIEDPLEKVDIFETHAHLREDWIRRLIKIAGGMERGVHSFDELDDRLDSLGYGGG